MTPPDNRLILDRVALDELFAGPAPDGLEVHLEGDGRSAAGLYREGIGGSVVRTFRWPSRQQGKVGALLLSEFMALLFLGAGLFMGAALLDFRGPTFLSLILLVIGLGALGAGGMIGLAGLATFRNDLELTIDDVAVRLGQGPIPLPGADFDVPLAEIREVRFGARRYRGQFLYQGATLMLSGGGQHSLTTGAHELDLYLATQIAETAEVKIIETPEAHFSPDLGSAWVLEDREWSPPSLRNETRVRIASAREDHDAASAHEAEQRELP